VATHDYRLDQGSHEASLTGWLAIHNGCLVVRDEWGNISPPVLPVSKVSLDDESDGIIFDGRRYPLGSHVSFGGSNIDGPFDDIDLRGCTPPDGWVFTVMSWDHIKQ